MRQAVLLAAAIVGVAAACSASDTANGDERADEGATRCELSEVGQAVLDAAQAATPKNSAIPAKHMLTFGNEPGEILITGREIFPELRALITNAERWVDLATFVWEPGSNGSDELLEGLRSLATRLAAQGRKGDPVRVRILVNAIGLAGMEEKTGTALAGAVGALGLDPALVQVEVATRTLGGLGSMHQKLAIIDNRAVHIGGANIETVHDWKDGAHPWNDSAYTLFGEVATSLARDFDTHWDLGRQWTCDSSGCTSSRTVPELLPRKATPADSCVPMMTLARWPTERIANKVDSQMDQGYLGAFGAAARTIKIMSPNLNDDAVRAALIDAIGRGVDVQIVLALGFNELTESIPGQGGGNAFNVDLLYTDAATRHGQDAVCQHLAVRWYTDPELGLIEGNGPGASHLKYTSVDGQLTIVGSANMDTQSWNQSGEANVAIDDAAATARHDAEVFDPAFARGQPTGHCP